MSRYKLNGLMVLLLVSLVLTACAGGATTAPTAPPLSLTAPSLDLTPALPSEGATGLAFNPGDGSLLRADPAGLFRLPAAGQAWEVIQTPATRNAGLTGVALNPDDPAALYVSGFGLGVVKSTDGGQTWSESNEGLMSQDVTTLAMHSFRYATLYVWLKDIGIFRTEDSGAHWARMPDQGPPDPAVRGLAHSTLPGSMNTGWLYAATPSGAYLSMDCF